MTKCNLFLVALALFGVQCLAFPSYIINPADPMGQASIFKRELLPDQDCIKDLLIVWDISSSVGNKIEKAKKFLAGLLENLSVAKDSTNVAIIVFSAKEETKILHRFTESQELSKVTGKIERVPSNNPGGTTLTGRALHLAATQVFKSSSPDNHRENFEDVLLLVTDGEPSLYQKSDEDLYKFYGVYNQPKREGELLVDKLAKILKDRSVKMIGVLIEKDVNDKDYDETDRDRFQQNVRRWTNEMSRLKASDAKEDVSKKVAGAGCIVKPACKCSNSTGHGTLTPGHDEDSVSWKVPILLGCGKEKTKPNTTVPKDVSPGHSFSKSQEIKYLFILDDKTTKTCPVHIDIQVCSCRDSRTITGYITEDSKITVGWKRPGPNCTAKLNNKPYGVFTKYGMDHYKFSKPGTRDFIYEYELIERAKSYDMKCRVEVVVEDCKCSPNHELVTADLPSGQQSVAVTWDVPKPTCDAGLKLINVVPTVKPGDKFSQNQLVKYHYQGASGLSLTCAVQIEINVVCTCPSEELRFPGYISPGETTVVTQFNKSDFPEETDACRLVLPQNPTYEAGKYRYQVNYLYGDKKCPMVINVTECSCQKLNFENTTLNDGGMTVTWPRPKPNCPVMLIKEPPGITSEDNGRDSYEFKYSQKKTVMYEYQLNGSERPFQCEVNIEVEVCKCSGGREVRECLNRDIIPEYLQKVTCNLSIESPSIKMSTNSSIFKEIDNPMEPLRWNTTATIDFEFTFLLENDEEKVCNPQLLIVKNLAGSECS